MVSKSMGEVEERLASLMAATPYVMRWQVV